MQSSKELDELFIQLNLNISQNSNYLKILLNAFMPYKEKFEKLELFYMIIPILSINYVEFMLVQKEQVAKKNPKNYMISVSIW